MLTFREIEEMSESVPESFGSSSYFEKLALLFL
jgi:hypothetical protein